jgi:hypothetical protein
MKSKVYVETSVIGYLTSWPSGDLIVAARQKITRDWWRDAPGRFELVVSEAVVREANVGDAKAIEDRMSAIRGLAILPPSQETKELVDVLLAQGAVPISEPEDAAHIAFAAVNGIEYLVSWNLKHIVNAAMRKKINSVCEAAGYVPPLICTPEELGEMKS